MAVGKLLLLGSSAVLAGCSGIRFSNVDDGKSHPYRVASPALKVVTDGDCKMTAEVISIPGRFNYLSFQTGLGKIDDSVEFEPGGTIKKITAKQEGVAEDVSKLLAAVTSAAKTVGAASFAERGETPKCRPIVQIYPINLDSQNNPYVGGQPLLTVEAQPAK